MYSDYMFFFPNVNKKIKMQVTLQHPGDGSSEPNGQGLYSTAFIW